MFERSVEERFAVLSAAFASWLDEVVAFDDSGEWMAGGATSISAWLAGRLNMARGAAREMVRVGGALRELPESHERGPPGRPEPGPAAAPPSLRHARGTPAGGPGV